MLECLLTEERAIVDESVLEATFIFCLTWSRGRRGGSKTRRARPRPVRQVHQSAVRVTSASKAKVSPRRSFRRIRCTSTCSTSIRGSGSRGNRASSRWRFKKTRSSRPSSSPTVDNRAFELASGDVLREREARVVRRRLRHREDGDHLEVPQGLGPHEKPGAHVKLFQPHDVAGRSARDRRRRREADEGHVRPGDGEEANLLLRRPEHAEGGHPTARSSPSRCSRR